MLFHKQLSLILHLCYSCFNTQYDIWLKKWDWSWICAFCMFDMTWNSIFTYYYARIQDHCSQKCPVFSWLAISIKCIGKISSFLTKISIHDRYQFINSNFNWFLHIIKVYFYMLNICINKQYCTSTNHRRISLFRQPNDNRIYDGSSKTISYFVQFVDHVPYCVCIVMDTFYNIFL